jgi:hypothetical protein
MTAKNIVMAAAGAGRQVDPNDAYTSLVLMGEGKNGGQNNTFLDSSASPKAITRYGNTTQGSFSPFSKEAGKWGVAFDGAGDYLTAPWNTNLELGNGNFTIEFWTYAISGNTLFCWSTDWHYGLVWNYRGADNNRVGIFASSNGTSWDIFHADPGGTGISTGTVTPNTWTHVAIVRNGSSWSLYLNGTSAWSGTSSATFVTRNSDSFRIGGPWPNAGPTAFNGTISNLRITKGAALYTSNFTPSSTPLTTSVPSGGTVSLLTCQDNRFKDNSSNNFTLTPYGDVKVTPFSPFSNNLAYSPSVHGGSAYFDGSGDYLTIANTNALVLSGNSWTAECWVYTNGDYSSWQTLFAKRVPGTGTTSYEGYLARSTGYISFYNGINYESTTVLAANSWNHCAWVYDGVNIKIYVNGISIYSAAVTITEQNTPLIIGDAGNGIEYTKGYISNFRIIKGTSLYTSTFAPPTSPLTAVSGTSLLCNFTNGAIIDSTGKNNLETVGSAQVSTTTKKFGNGAMYFDGNGDYLTIPASPNLQFGTGDFTVEAWVNPIIFVNGANNYFPIIDTRFGVSSTSYVAGIWSGKLDFYYGNGGGRYTAVSNIVSVNNWQHIAIIRQSGTIMTFVNGIKDSLTTTYSGSLLVESSTILIGRLTDGDVANGYIDELRITKGKALYTSNFTPTSIANYY